MAPQGKRKREKVEIEVDLSAKSLANDWIKGMGGGKSKKDDDGDSSEEEGFSVPRPNRLGVGAKFIPHSKALDVSQETGDRISGKLKKVKKGDDDGVAAARVARKAAAQEEEESRTDIKTKPKASQPAHIKAQVNAAIVAEDGKKKKKKKKKTNEKEKAAGGAGARGGGEGGDSVAVSANAGGDMEDEGKAQPRQSELGVGGGGQRPNDDRKGEGENGEWVDRAPRRKRVKGKKTRSRQKNLRKDNRPAHLKPGFVAE